MYPWSNPDLEEEGHVSGGGGVGAHLPRGTHQLLQQLDLQQYGVLVIILGLHWILNWPDIRPICFAGYPVSGRISG